jgi:ribosome-associated protein
MDHDADAPVDSDRPSKTQRKKEMTALQDLGARLVALKPEQLARIELPAPLRDAIDFAHRITKHEARRRHLQYIGKLMRSVDGDSVRRALADATGASHAAVALMHRCERWRDRLLADDHALADLLAELPADRRNAGTQELRALVRAARREREGGQAPRHARELYRWLHEQLGAATGDVAGLTAAEPGTGARDA